MVHEETSWPGSRVRARVVPAAVRSLRAEAEARLAVAEREASRRLAEAESAARALAEEARQAGREAGLGEAAATIAEVHARRAALLDAEETRADLVRLAMAIAERILGEPSAVPPETWARACARAVAPLRDSRGLVIRVAPGAGAAVRAAVEALAAESGAAPALRVEEDSRVDDAGCVVEGEAGRVDARLSTQLAALRRALLGEGA